MSDLVEQLKNDLLPSERHRNYSETTYWCKQYREMCLKLADEIERLTHQVHHWQKSDVAKQKDNLRLLKENRALRERLGEEPAKKILAPVLHLDGMGRLYGSKSDREDPDDE